MTGLASRNRRSISDAALSGLAGSRGPHISIRGGRFHLVNGGGEEYHVPTHYLDIVVVDASEHPNKVFFAYDYDPNVDMPPDCFSDNGTGPSTQSVAPQAASCTVCPWNRRGSDTTFTGKPTKACQDRKKLAAIILDDPSVTVYEFQIPPGSVTNLKAYNEWLRKQPSPSAGRTLDIADVVTRVEFDPQKQFTMKFSAVSMADDDRTLQLIDYIDANKLSDQSVGRGDVAWNPEDVKQLLAATGAGQLAPPALQQQQPNPNFTLPQQHNPAALAPPPNAGTPLTAPGTPTGRRGRRPNPAAAAPTAAAGTAPAAPFMAGQGQGAGAPPAGAPALAPPPAAPAPAPAPEAQLNIPPFLRRDPQTGQPPTVPAPGDRAGFAAAPPPPPAVQNALAGAMALASRRPAG